jgi:hypothetical protein
MRGSKNLKQVQAVQLQIRVFMGWLRTLHTLSGKRVKQVYQVMPGLVSERLLSISPPTNSLPSLLLSGAVTGIFCRKLNLLKKHLKQVREPAKLQDSLLSVSGNSKNLPENRTGRTHPEGLQVQEGLQGVWPEVQDRSQVRIT